jgi:pyrroline-5-carboxylate reductase
MELGFIGTGEITSSIVKGLSSSGTTTHSIRLSPRNFDIANALSSRFKDVSVASTNQDVVDHSEIVVIAVRPPVAERVLSELRFRPVHTIISLVSALSLRKLTALVMPAKRVIRAVPLPSTAKRAGPTAIYPADPAGAELFSSVGTVFAVESEHEFNAICAATATIATHFAFANRIASWLERQGVAETKARDYIARLYQGVTMGAVDEPHRSFDSLASSHATSGGINEQFLKHVVECGFLTSISDGLDAVLDRLEASADKPWP